MLIIGALAFLVVLWMAFRRRKNETLYYKDYKMTGYQTGRPRKEQGH